MSDDLLIHAISVFQYAIYRRLAIVLELPVNAYQGDMFNPLNPSTLTVGFYFDNVQLHEAKDVKRFQVNEEVVLIGSTTEEIVHPSYNPIKEINTTKPRRGRKPKVKKPKKAHTGHLKHFSSQITFMIKSQILNNKLYKFKVFRTGFCQIPGILKDDMSDVKEPRETLRLHLCKYLNVDAQITKPLDYHMRNCKTILNDRSLFINIPALGELLNRAIAENENPRGMVSAKYVTDVSTTKVTIKFARPTLKKPDKMLTLKVHAQKINYEGGTTLEDIYATHEWFNQFVLDKYASVIVDPNAPSDESSDDEA